MSEPVAIPLQEAIDAGDPTIAAPRRGRGRPRGSKNRVHLGLPSRGARQRAERAPARASAPARGTSLKTRVGGLIVTVNMALLIIPPLSADALSVGEIDALASAIDVQCQQSARFRKYVEAALSAGAGGQLLGVVAMIGARRAARHGMLGPNGAIIDGMLGSMFNDTGAPAAPAADLPPAGADVSGVMPPAGQPSAMDTRPLWTPPHEPDNTNGNTPHDSAFNFEATLALQPDQ